MNDYIGFLPAVERTIQPDGIHMGKEIYDSDHLNGLRGTKRKHEVRYDPYELDRVWVRHPESREWIECAARSVRLTALPFGRTVSANLAAIPPVDDGSDKWGEAFLAAEKARVKEAKKDAAKAKRASKKATKAAAEMANRKNDDMPRPGPVAAPPLPPAVPLPSHADDYKIV